MTPRHIATLSLTASVLVLAACGPAPRANDEPEAPRPNIVFVLLDDVRYDDVIDHPFADLPNLTRLAHEGASFQRFFTSAPLCSPSRAVFMTGQYPYRNGITDNAERAELSHRIVTFPKLLRDAGYHTGFFGKWHMSHEDDSPRPGFDRWVSFLGQGVYFDPDLNIDGEVVASEGYMTDILTDHAISFIEDAPSADPFLVFVAQKAVHPETFPNFVRTFPPAPGDEELYAGAQPHHAPNWRAPTDGKPALARPVDANDPRSPEGGLPDAVILDRIRMLSAVDRSLGSLIAALETKGVLDETIFVVTSDQGFFYGEFGLAQERRLAYEPSTHIPLIVRYPARIRAGSTPDALASNVDIAPTMLELGGAAVPANMDGRSLVAVLDDDASTVRDDFLVEYYSDTVFPRLQGMGYKAVRTDRYKYIRYEELVGMDELYDIEADPFELDNLLPDRAPAGVVDDMAARMERLLGRG
ncbi:MAG: sulfatase-like hydrolase/transferase [Gemmatimonadetes bacterium]|nr:sulfatase-like hydrolase/transferase [Gemmatimonadota bacterium]MDA1104857.1 sulfatase-like hydrolase/transferase [Gemmatimonadota bacterium]